MGRSNLIDRFWPSLEAVNSVTTKGHKMRVEAPELDAKIKSLKAALLKTKATDDASARIKPQGDTPGFVSQLSYELARYAVCAFADERLRSELANDLPEVPLQGGEPTKKPTHSEIAGPFEGESLHRSHTDKLVAVNFAIEAGEELGAIWQRTADLKKVFVPEADSPLSQGSFSQPNAGELFFEICDRLLTNFLDRVPNIHEAAEVYYWVLVEGYRGVFAVRKEHNNLELSTYLDNFEKLLSSYPADILSERTRKKLKISTNVAMRSEQTDPVDRTQLPENGRTISYIRNGLKAQIPTVHRVRLGGGAGCDIFVNDGGVVLGPQSEGTSAIIMFARSVGSSFPEAEVSEERKVIGALEDEDAALRDARAVRLPRLLTGDLLLNFQLAETCFFEHQQSAQTAGRNALCSQSIISFVRPNLENSHENFGFSRSDPTFVAFYLSPGEPTRVGLIGERNAWPKDLTARLGDSISDVYRQLQEIGEMSKEGAFDKMYYIPSGAEAGAEPSRGAPTIISREIADTAYKGKALGGWWAFAPVAVSVWMVADLQRLLNHVVFSEPNDPRPFLRSKSLPDWIYLSEHLCAGLANMHSLGLVHGDIRPANVMKKVGAQISSFEWIDIGMGYSTPGNVPRASGGGRYSPFYAPERAEDTEFEDVDSVRLSVDHEAPILELLYKPNTGAEPIPLELGAPGIERDGASAGPSGAFGASNAGLLTGLRRGDRMLVREFMFEVEEVSRRGVRVSKVYEVFLGRLFVQQSPADVAKRFGSFPVARLKILWQWGQASDIYGLGLVTLYTFFMRGLWAIDYFDPNQKAVLIGKGRDLNQLFSRVVNVLTSESFLDCFLSFLHNNEGEETPDGSFRFADGDDLLALSPEMVAKIDSLELEGVEKATIDRLTSVLDRTWWLESGFEAVYYGVNSSPALFAMLIYFVLRCVWRGEQIAGMTWNRLNVNPGSVGFRPFCHGRDFKSKANVEVNGPAEEALRYLNRLREKVSSTSRVFSAQPINPTRRYTTGLPIFEKLTSLLADLDAASDALTEVGRRRDTLKKAVGDIAWLRLHRLSAIRAAIEQEVDNLPTEVPGLEHKRVAGSARDREASESEAIGGRPSGA